MFGVNCFTENADGTLLFSAGYTDMENLIHWLLTFGDRVQVLEPEEVKKHLIQIANNMLEQYKTK